MTLSILILTIPGREKLVQELLSRLQKMVGDYNDVQVLCLYDNKSMTVGAKRQKLFDMADGDYVQFVDDDDDLSEDYIDSVYPLLVRGKHDLITYQFQYTDNVGGDKLYFVNEPDCQPNHTHLWRKSIIKRPFADISFGEDRQWSIENLPFVTSRHHIDKTLYNYRYNTEVTETQK